MTEKDIERPENAQEPETVDAKTDHDEDVELPHLDGARQSHFWEDLRDSLPPWLDEIIAIILLIFGILSFMALLNPTQAVVAVAWANILNTFFGYGSFLVAGGLFIMGIVLLLPKAGIVIRFPPGRIVAIEAAALCLLALFHLGHGDNELRAIARAGEGGGIIGWGLSAIPFWLLGRIPSALLFGTGLLVAAAIVIGVRRSHVIQWFEATGQRLQRSGNRLSPVRISALETAKSVEARQPFELDPEIILNNRRLPLMRIRADKRNLPPSMRNSNRDKDDEINIEEHPLFNKEGRELKSDFNLIGEVTKRKTEDGHRIVIRPDGREKRYFGVDEMNEEKKVGRRSKTLPSLDILQDVAMEMPEEEEINRTAVLIENTLLEFDIDIDVVEVQVGPTVTRYAVQPYHLRKDGSIERTKLSKIAAYSNDLSLALSAKRLRLEIPVPGTNYMGIEVPNRHPSLVTLRSVYESRNYYDQAKKNASPLLVPLGRDVSGRPVTLDIAKMPHLLIAGTTGSGKSVAIGAMAAALIMNNHPDTVKMVMLDPKMVELSRFNGLPHLLGPVETDTERIIGVLKWCTREMDRRYKLLEEHGVRNIDGYNEKFGGGRRKDKDYMPYIVILIDEIGDLMLSRPEETETAITRLAQMARAVGMHLVIATQRPSVDVITGLIKANFPGRIAFSVASGVDSRVILDSVGAETLLGQGDMLYVAPDAGVPKRVQGCYVSDEEVRQLVQHWIDWHDQRIEAGKAERLRRGPWERGLTRREFLAETDEMLEEAIEFVVETQEASASLIQRRLGLGYPRAARIMDMLAELGVVGESVGGGRARKVLIPKGEDPFKRIIDNRLKQKASEKSASDT